MSAPTVQASPPPARPPRGLRTLANLAFAESRSVIAVSDVGHAGRHLAFLTSESFALDLSDPEQRHFGQYELLELLGEGGMGVVYRARQIGLEREVALKLLSAGPWASRDFVERFRHEAQHAGRMQHPNIVAIHEIGAHEDLHYFSMRLVRGASLAAHLRASGGRLPAREAARLLRTVAEAVDYAHRLNVLHLDLKPGNILLDELGEPHVADFGLAKRLDVASAAVVEEISGTPAYMAPEQAAIRDQRLSAATDIWGLGAVLYELLTGSPPFLGATPHATLALVRDAPVPRVRETNTAVPRDLDAIVAKALRKDPAERYASAREFADDLGQFLDGRAVAARPLNALQRSWRWARREPYLAIASSAAMLALLVGLATTSQQWQRAEGNAHRAAESAQHAEQSAATASERLWQSRREAALRLQTDGKGFESLPALIDNIEEQERAGIADAGHIERREVGMVLAQSPVLIDRMLVPDAMLLAAALSDDGSLAALGFGDMTVRWYDTATLTERGRVDLSDVTTTDDAPRLPRLLRFAGNTRLIATLEWDEYWANPTLNDSALIDLERARLVPPPVLPNALPGTNYSPDGSHALAFDHANHMQVWRVAPSQPVSTLIDATALANEAETTPRLLAPGQRIIITLARAVSKLLVFDPHSGANLEVDMPPDLATTAWCFNHNGSLLALGDSRGRLFLIDPATRKVRQLPTPFGREVTWVAFSEDDAWVAATRWDGAVFAFDVASGEPLHSGVMQDDHPLREVAISHAERLVVASGPGPDNPARSSIWRLPESGPNGLPANRLLSSPSSSAAAAYNATATSLATGLMLTTTLRGEVNLWRLPRAPAQAARSGQMLNVAAQPYDGTHLPDVAWTRLRVAQRYDAPATPWVDLGQPANYSVLLDDGLLLAIAGHTLHAFDASNMQPRYAPVELEGTPRHVAASADGAVLALSFPGNGPTGFEERLEIRDARSGRRTAAGAAVRGPVRMVALSDDATRLLVTGPVDGATELFDTATLHAQARYPHDPDKPVAWASFSADPQRIWLLARPYEDPSLPTSDLIDWHPRDGTQERQPLPGLWGISVHDVGGKPYLTGRDQVLLDPKGPAPRMTERTVQDEASAAVAVSPDGHLIAQAYGRDVQLFDAATLAPLGPPLHSNCGAWDGVFQLAFSPDGRELRGRIRSGNWLLWPVGADLREVARLREDASLLTADQAQGAVLRGVGTAEHASLRARDPGAWRAPSPRPKLAAVAMIAGIPVPPRDARAGPYQLDLSAAYNLAPDGTQDQRRHINPVMADRVPLGTVRLDGVDYDVRGQAELRWRTIGTSQMVENTPPIAVPAVPIAAFHVLLNAPLRAPEPEVRTYAVLTLRYRDGSQAKVPLRLHRELPGLTGDDDHVPMAWTGSVVFPMIGLWHGQTDSNPRLVNPHPERLVASVSLDTAHDYWSAPVLYAITAEPVIAAAPTGMQGSGGTTKQ